MLKTVDEFSLCRTYVGIWVIVLGKPFFVIIVEMK